MFCEDMNRNLSLYVRQDNQTIKISNKNILKYVKKNFQRYYHPDNLDLGLFKSNQHCYENHKCA